MSHSFNPVSLAMRAFYCVPVVGHAVAHKLANKIQKALDKKQALTQEDVPDLQTLKTLRKYQLIGLATTAAALVYTDIRTGNVPSLAGKVIRFVAAAYMFFTSYIGFSGYSFASKQIAKLAPKQDQA